MEFPPELSNQLVGVGDLLWRLTDDNLNKLSDWLHKEMQEVPQSDNQFSVEALMPLIRRYVVAFVTVKLSEHQPQDKTAEQQKSGIFGFGEWAILRVSRNVWEMLLEQGPAPGTVIVTPPSPRLPVFVNELQWPSQ